MQDATDTAATAVRPRRRLSRAERSEELRKAIFAAAAKLIGERGYAEASIARIAESVGIAQGTFYLYFESRQALFDELLLTLGRDMLAWMHEAVTGAGDFFEVEERGLRGLLDYLEHEPSFSRILHEAEFVAPEAYGRHYRVLRERYVDSLRRASKAGQIRNFRAGELEVLANMLIHARAGLTFTMRQKAMQGEKVDKESCIRTYMKLVRNGVT